MSWAAYLALTQYDRYLVHDELSEMILRVDEAGEVPSRPKRQRK